MNKITLKIDGMMCGMCEAHINDTVRKAYPAAKKVTSSHKKGETTFLFEGDVAEDTLRAAIDATGYTMTAFCSEPYVKKGLFKR